MTHKEFASYNRSKYPNGIDPQEAVHILAEHFLGDYVIEGYPASGAQWNSEVVYKILQLYPRGSIRKIKKHYTYPPKTKHKEVKSN